MLSVFELDALSDAVAFQLSAAQLLAHCCAGDVVPFCEMVVSECVTHFLNEAEVHLVPLIEFPEACGVVLGRPCGMWPEFEENDVGSHSEMRDDPKVRLVEACVLVFYLLIYQMQVSPSVEFPLHLLHGV